MKKQLLKSLNQLTNFDEAQLAFFLKKEPLERDKVAAIKKHLMQLHNLTAQTLENRLSEAKMMEHLVEINEEIEICTKLANKLGLAGKEKLKDL